MNFKNDFTKFLSECTSLSDQTVYNISITGIAKCSEYVRRYIPTLDSIYDYDALDEVQSFQEILDGDEEFQQMDNGKWKKMYSNAMAWYLRYVKAKDMFRAPECTTLLDRPSVWAEADHYVTYISAIRTKPFLLLAGISGSGKSKIVRDLARACWPLNSDERTNKKPMNYELIQVKPNWHDSSELIGYRSRINGDEYVDGKFLRFVVRAWNNKEIPFFLCLDEMNLAPVEQYFAEYLSVIETRTVGKNGKISTDPLIDRSNDSWYRDLVEKLTDDEDLRTQFLTEGISLPPNLVVVGTVNMDETTFTFSRKVLDRAMTIEMNDVDLTSGLGDDIEANLVLEGSQVIGDAAEGKDVYGENKGVCDSVIDYLCEINAEFEGTPFKIGYRARNEFLLYAVNRLLLTKGDDRDAIFRKALDEMTSMKILSRIEGDDQKVRNREGEPLLPKLKEIIIGRVGEGDNEEERPVSVRKIEEMEAKLNHTGFTSFWS